MGTGEAADLFGKTHIVDRDYFIAEMMPGLNANCRRFNITEYIEDRLGLIIAHSHADYFLIRHRKMIPICLEMSLHLQQSVLLFI